MTVLTDKLTVNEGNIHADFDMLFQQHYDRVYGILFRLLGNRSEAEDVAQEVFLKLYNNPPRHNNVGPWLYRVATNSGYNAVRGRKRQWQRNTLLVKPEGEQDRAGDPAAHLIAQEDVETVRQALTKLKPQQAQLLLLRQMGLSYAELASACDINPNSVGKQLSRASDAFKSAYLLISREHTPHA